MEPRPLLKPREVLLTGATGFVGRHVARELTERGWKVRSLVRGQKPAPERTEAVRGDLDRVRELAPRLRGLDAVIHAAALLDPIDDAEAGDRINRRATMELARASADAGVGAFVFVSSIAALGVGPDAGLVGPDAPCRPTTIYGRSKRAAEEALLKERDERMRVAIVRPPTVYGEGERRNFLALTRAIDKGLFLVPGRGDNRMSFCHVQNLAVALAVAAEDDRAEGILHAADAEPVTLRHVAVTIARALGRRPPWLPFPMPVARLAAHACEFAARPFGVTPPLSPGRLTTLTSDLALDCRALSALGYRPPTSFESGVRETIAFYRREGLLK